MTAGTSLILWVVLRTISWSIASNIDGAVATTLYFLINFSVSFVLILEIGTRVVDVKQVNRPSGVVMASLVCLSVLTILISVDDVAHEAAQTLRLMGAGAFGLWIGRRVMSVTFIWPIVIVASAMDIGSILISDSFTNAVVNAVTTDPNLIHPLLVYTPQGSFCMPMFGLADIAFSMILVGAAVQLELSTVRVRWGAMTGCLVGLVFLFLFQMPLPLLPFLGFGAALALGKQAAVTLDEVFLVLKFLFVIGVLFGLSRLI